MTGTCDPLLADGGMVFVVGLLPDPWRTFWRQAALVSEGDDKAVFSAPSDVAPFLVASASKFRQAMKDVHCSTPTRYKIEIQSMDGDVTCI